MFHLIVLGPAVEDPVVLGGGRGVAQRADGQVVVVLAGPDLVQLVGVVEGPPPEGG